MSNALNILLIEDNEGDQVLLEAELELSGIAFQLQILQDGEALRDFLTSPRIQSIDLMLMDLNLPRVSGFELLEAKNASPYRELPIMVLSSSSSPRDIATCRQLKAHGYCSKPLNLTQLNLPDFVARVRGDPEVWLELRSK